MALEEVNEMKVFWFAVFELNATICLESALSHCRITCAAAFSI